VRDAYLFGANLKSNIALIMPALVFCNEGERGMNLLETTSGFVGHIPQVYLHEKWKHPGHPLQM